MGTGALIIGSGMINAATGAINNSMSDFYNSQSQHRAYAYNEAAANHADARTRALYRDFYSPSAMLKQYREAGLSPSLMFGGGAGAGGTTPQGAQGEGASGMQTHTYGINPIDLAQIELMKAQTRKTNAEAANEEGVSEKGKALIANIMQDTETKLTQAGLNKAAKALEEANTVWQNVQTNLANDTYWANVEKSEHEAELMQAKVQEAWAEARIKIKDAEFSEETFEEREHQYKQGTLLKAREILLKDEEIKLTKEQREYVDSLTEKTYNDICYEWAQLQQDLDKFNKTQDLEKQKVYWQNYNERMNRKVKTLELKLKRRDIELRHADRKAKTFVSTINTIVGTYGLSALKTKGYTKTTEKYNPNGSSQGWEIETVE